MLETEVSHHRADNRTDQGGFRLAGQSQNIKELIAVHQVAIPVHHHDAVAITIERNTDIGFDAPDRHLQQIRVRRAAALIDVATVR